jgi:hypothetical protein
MKSHWDGNRFFCLMINLKKHIDKHF